MKTFAYLSDDRRYRYWLTREWDERLPMMCVIGMNPSTADESANDPTIRKCIGFATRLGFGSLLMLNVMAYRSTNPRECLKAVDPFGPLNTVEHLKEYIACRSATCRLIDDGPETTKGITCVVAAWGKNCEKYRPLSRALAIAHSIPNLMCWGRNKAGSPRHPLMLPYSTQLERLDVDIKWVCHRRQTD